MNLQLDQQILNHRGDTVFLNDTINKLVMYKGKLDVQIQTFLERYCPGVHGIEQTELDASNPVYRYFNHKRMEYAQVERLIRVAKAYK